MEKEARSMLNHDHLVPPNDAQTCRRQPEGGANLPGVLPASSNSFGDDF